MTLSARRCSSTILFFANTSWYLWNFRVRLAERLIAEGYEVVFCAPPDEYSDRLVALGRFVSFPMDRKGRNPLRELGLLFRVWRLLGRERPDAVLTWTPKPNIYGSLAGRLLRVPVLPNVAGLGFAFIGGGWLARITGVLYRWAFVHCPVVYFQNREDLDKFVNAGWADREKVRLLPGSGVDLKRFRPRDVAPSPVFAFLFLGRLLADKGLRELVEATRRLKRESRSFRLLLAGFVDSGNPAGVPREEIDDWEREGLVEYLGATDQPENVLCRADCVILPSYREGLPRSLLEAAACALPVITTDVPGCRDAVRGGVTASMCMPRDVESLLDAMRRMLEMSEADRRAMGEAGRKWVEENFSEQRVIRAYMEALSHIGGVAERVD